MYRIYMMGRTLDGGFEGWSEDVTAVTADLANDKMVAKYRDKIPGFQVVDIVEVRRG